VDNLGYLQGFAGCGRDRDFHAQKSQGVRVGEGKNEGGREKNTGERKGLSIFILCHSRGRFCITRKQNKR